MPRVDNYIIGGRPPTWNMLRAVNMTLLPFSCHLPQGYKRCWRLFRKTLEGKNSSGEGCSMSYSSSWEWAERETLYLKPSAGGTEGWVSVSKSLGNIESGVWCLPVFFKNNNVLSLAAYEGQVFWNSMPVPFWLGYLMRLQSDVSQDCIHLMVWLGL